MRAFAVVGLALLLVASAVAAEQTMLSFAAEFCAGALAATISFDAVLFRASGAFTATETPRPMGRDDSREAYDVLLELAVTPLSAGAAVTCVGWLFGVSARSAGFASILAASVGELFALRVWDLDVPGWLRVLAVPVITALGATVGFNLQASAIPHHPSP